MTPAEFNGFAGEYAKTRELQIELGKATAYWTAALSRTKTMPKFDRWMNPPKPVRALAGSELEARKLEHEEDVARLMESKIERASRAKKEEDGG